MAQKVATGTTFRFIAYQSFRIPVHAQRTTQSADRILLRPATSHAALATCGAGIQRHRGLDVQALAEETLPRIGRGTSKFGLDGLSRVLFPLITLLLVLVGKAVLKNWHPVNLLNITVPLLLAAAGIRLAVYALRRVFAPSSWLHRLGTVDRRLDLGRVRAAPDGPASRSPRRTGLSQLQHRQAAHLAADHPERPALHPRHDAGGDVARADAGDTG